VGKVGKGRIKARSASKGIVLDPLLALRAFVLRQPECFFSDGMNGMNGIIFVGVLRGNAA
jgi:hypothetical protein